MFVGWVDLVRRPFAKRNDFASVDARNYSNNSKAYEMITSPPSTFVMPKTPDTLVTSPPPEHEEGIPPLPQSPPLPSSQYTNDYFNKDAGSKSRQLSSYLPQEADYRSPKLSFSTPQPPSAGRSFSRESYGRFHESQMGRTSPGRPFSPHARRESEGSTFSSAYDWDPTTTYAPPSTHVASSYSRPDAYN